MQRITFLFTCALIVFSSVASAQKVKRRDGLLSLNGKPYLTYEVTKNVGVQIYAYHTLGEEETLFQAHICSNWTFEGGDAYRHYYFPSEELELILPAKRKWRFKLLLPLMVENGVMDEDANIDGEALSRFIARYNVPLPRRFGPKVHQLPVISETQKKTHRWEYSKDYDQVKKEWK